MVLNRRSGRIPISDETRKRVLQAMQELGYTPNPVAQMLAGGSTRLIGVFTYEAVFPYRRDDFYFPFLLGIQREASRQDYNLLLFTRNHQVGRGVFDGGTNALQLADGAVLMGPYPDRAELRRLTEEGYPFVYIGRREVPGCAIDWAVSDYQSGSAAITRHLIELGHRRLAYIEFHADLESSCDRLAGCQAAAAKGAEILVWDREALAEPQQSLAEMREAGATAIICEGVGTFDLLLRLAQGSGLQVPADLSLACLADCGTLLANSPMPTQLRLNTHAVGEAAVRILASRLDGTAPPEPQHLLVPCDFVAGDTTAPPRSGRL